MCGHASWGRTGYGNGVTVRWIISMDGFCGASLDKLFNPALAAKCLAADDSATVPTVTGHCPSSAKGMHFCRSTHASPAPSTGTSTEWHRWRLKHGSQSSLPTVRHSWQAQSPSIAGAQGMLNGSREEPFPSREESFPTAVAERGTVSTGSSPISPPWRDLSDTVDRFRVTAPRKGRAPRCLCCRRSP